MVNLRTVFLHYRLYSRTSAVVKQRTRAFVALDPAMAIVTRDGEVGRILVRSVVIGVMKDDLLAI